MADRKISSLTALTAPADNDLFVVVDTSEAANANKNKSLTFQTLHRGVGDGTAASPSISFLSDAGVDGLFKPAQSEVAVSINGTYNSKFTAAGFQVGTGAATAQLHLFSADTTDQVIIENTDAGLDTAPDVVLYRNSASPAADDFLGNLEFRGKNDAAETIAYGQVFTKIADATDDSEDGTLQLITIAAGASAARVTVKGDKVGINEPSPQHSLHITESIASTGLFIESEEAVSVSAADITLYHHRGSSISGQDADVLSTINFQGNNDASTPEQILFGAVEASIVDASDTIEEGKLDFKVQSAGSLTSMAAITAVNVTLGSRPVLPTHTPASATAAGTTGEVAWDANYIYICTATNTWKRVAISTWS